MGRILILRPGALGDFVMTLPVAAGLRERYPDAHVEVLARGSIAALADGIATRTGDLDAAGLHAFFTPGAAPDPKAAEFIRSFDLIISWLGDEFDRAVSDAGPVVVSVPCRPPSSQCGAPLNASRFFYQAVPQLRDVPWRPPRVQLTHDEKHQARGILRDHGLDPGRPIVGIHPGSGGRSKCWPPGHFATVIRALLADRRQVVTFCGEADATAVGQVQRAAGKPVPVLRDLSLRTLAGALSLCWRYLGNDSGVSHLAAAAGADCTVLFGPTDPAAWAPLGTNVRVLTADVPCRPCGEANPACSRRFECLLSLATERVLAELAR